MQQRFATGIKVQPQLAGAHARLSVHVLDILNHDSREKQRLNGDSARPNSLLRRFKVWYTMPALFDSPDSQIKRRQMLALTESDMTHPFCSGG